MIGDSRLRAEEDEMGETKWGVWSLSIPSPGWIYGKNMTVMSWSTREEAEEYARQCREFYVPNRYEARPLGQ